MGYYTDYSVRISGFQNQDEAEFFEFKEFHKQGGTLHYFRPSTSTHVYADAIEFHLSQYKWYEWQTDLEPLSKRYPHLLFEVKGVGEEFPDIWKARIRDGKTEVVQAEITFPDFKEIS